MKSILSFLFTLNCIYFFNTSSTLAANIEAGEKIFISNCAVCHNGGQNVILADKNLQLDTLKKYEMDSIKAITTQVTNGKNAMPAFSGRLSSDDITNVANYVLNQSQEGWPED